jgi:hypothetical protein
MTYSARYLRLGVAACLSLTIGGTAVASTGAAPSSLADRVASGFQGSAVYDPEPRPLRIHGGTCDDLDDDVATLSNVVAPDGSYDGSDDRDRTEYSFTGGIPFTIGQLLDDDHVVLVEVSELNDDVLACGNIGGVTDANGSLVVPLRGDDDDDDDVYGIVVLSPGGGGTDASVFITGASLGDDIGSRVDDDDRDDDNDGRDDDDRDGDGQRDDVDDDDDDDGVIDDDDDGDGRTYDDDDAGDDDQGGDDDGAGDDGADDDGGSVDDDGGSDDDGADDSGDDDGADDDGGDDDGGGDVVGGDD